MHRIRVALFAGLVVVTATMLVFAYVTARSRQQVRKRVESDVVRAQKELLRVARLEGLELADKAATFAREDEFVQIFAGRTDSERQRAAYIACEVRKARLERPGDDAAPAKVGIIGVVDAAGLVVGRDLQIAWRRRDNLKKDFPSIALALAGQPNKDIWNLDGKMYRVGAAPIRGALGNVLGAVFVGYVQSARDAVAEREVLGVHVAYFLDEKIHASSFQRIGDESSGERGESAEEDALETQIFHPNGSSPVREAIAAHAATNVFNVRIGREDLLAAAVLLPGNATPSKSGFIVLSSLTAAQAAVNPLHLTILALGLVAILSVVGTAVFTGRRFLVPLERIEAGISEVINGNFDYLFESPSADYEGLANALNVMLARLLGRPDPDVEEGDEDESVSMYGG